MRVTNEVPSSSRCTTKSIAKKSPISSLPPAVPLAITPTFRPWTHTSDYSYIYQLSIVVATATVSFPPGLHRNIGLHPKRKICACVRLILGLVGKKTSTCVRLIMVLVGVRQTARTNEITRTFRPWTHTSDDSNIYQLSLVVATATVSLESTSYQTSTVKTILTYTVVSETNCLTNFNF